VGYGGQSVGISLPGLQCRMASLRKQIAAVRLVVAKREPEVLTAIGQESVRNGTDTMTSRQIDRIIKDVRLQMRKRNLRG
jgi:pantothenate kinase type III